MDDSVIARLKKQNHNFEILVNCEKAVDFKKGNSSLDDVLVSEDIFKDVKKGEHASEHDLKNIFGTYDKRKVAEFILKEGEVQLTAEYRNKLREEKKKQVIFLISRYAMDPKTNLPHPPQRIENAMNEKKVKIDEFKSAESQIERIISELRDVLPISYEIKRLNLVIPADAAAKSFGALKKYTKMLKEEWLSDGSLSVDVEVPAGLQNNLFDDLNNIAHRRIESKELK
jgi:ribosome maturation protein SDO1